MTMGFPFLDQLTAIAQKYIGTSKLSSKALISLCAESAFFHSGSGIGGLNWSMSRCGLALGLVDVSGNGCLMLDLGLSMGLITIGLSDLTQCDGVVVLVGGASAWGEVGVFLSLSRVVGLGHFRYGRN